MKRSLAIKILKNKGRKLSREQRIKNKFLFAQMVKRKYPEIYRAAIDRIEPIMSLNGLGAETTEKQSGFIDSLISSISTAMPAYLQLKQQQTLFKMQMDRAKAGLPPANVADYAPVLKTQVDIAPDTRNALISETSSMLKPLFLTSALLIAGFGVKQLLKKKGR